MEWWVRGLNRHPAKVFLRETWDEGSNPSRSAMLNRYRTLRPRPSDAT